MKSFSLLLLSSLVIAVTCFGGSEDRFIKKYAMMKIYESCFGPEVVKQIRKEMKAACAKCAALEEPSTPPPPPNVPQSQQPQIQDGSQPENSLFNNPQQPGFDVEKLHQAILAYRPGTSFGQGGPFRPYPASPAGFYQNPAFAPAAFQPNPMFYPYQQVPFSPYNFPVVGQQYFGSRMSRDMDIKSQLEALTSRMSGRVRNVTCVMQELGYLDDNLEPNFEKISERIGNLPVGDELKRDMQDGVVFCQQFSQCVPEVKKEKSPLSRELIRPMFFFKCYKHKKLEACIMKDVREKYSGVSDEDFDGDVELRRQGKSTKMPKNDDIDDLASSMYEFLYASDSNLELDSIL